MRTLQIKLNHNTFHKILIFDERRKPDGKSEERGKKSLGQENQQTQPKHSVVVEIEPEPHQGEANAVTTAPTLLLTGLQRDFRVKLPSYPSSVRDVYVKQITNARKQN